MKRIYMIAGLVMSTMLWMTSCNESLQDTYSDYAGDGAIRYLGRPTDLSVSPGWKRLIVRWKNNVDPNIDQIKVKWRLDAVSDSVLLPKGTVEYSIGQIAGRELASENYEVTISSVDYMGGCSLESSTYGRPYTYDHEDVQAFNRLVSKVYVIGSRVLLVFLPWQDELEGASLSYTKKNGQSASIPLTQELTSKEYWLMDDEIDTTQPILVNRTGMLAGCSDLIAFEPLELSTERTFEADLMEDFKRQYGVEEFTDSWIDGITTLYLDRDYTSFIDLLNFRNLKKIVLGSRRYLLSSEVDDASYAQSKVFDAASSNLALSILNELKGVTVERYNRHYSSLSAASYITEMGAPKEPEVTLLDLKDASLKCTPADESGFDSHLSSLIDGDAATYWEPMRYNEYNEYELQIDLKSVKSLNGMKVVQRYFSNTQEMAVMPINIKIKISENGQDYVDATYMEQVMLGNSNGEVNYIPFGEGAKKARYVQIAVPASYYFGLYFSSLAEIGLY